jgi:hypothetical protein
MIELKLKHENLLSSNERLRQEQSKANGKHVKIIEIEVKVDDIVYHPHPLLPCYNKVSLYAASLYVGDIAMSYL